MIYRTSQRGTYRNITSNLDLLSWRIAQLSNKMASEKNVNKPSDDPSGAAAILRTRTTLSETAQHKANVDYANTWLTNSGNVMDSVKGALDEIYAKAEQGATDTYTADQRRIIATEIDALFQSIIQFSDSKFGDNYLLGGSKVDSPPFSQLLRAQDVVAACENSTLWTGAVQNWGGREFEPRPDLPTQSQKFLVEVVQAGGVDSRFYATQSSLSTARIDGGDYVLKIDAKDQSFNQTKIRLATGPENVDRTGAANSEVVYSFNPASADPLTVIYVHGPTTMSSAVAAEYSAAAHTVTVRLKTVGFDPPSASAQTSSEVTAWAIASAVNALGVVSAAASLGGAGQVDLAPGPGGQPLNTVISFNHKTSVEVDGDEVTIYLERATNYLGGAVTATAQEAADALSADPIAGARLTASILGDPTAVAQATTAFRPLLPTDPYTLAQVVAEIPGTHNDVAFFVQNVSGAPVGEAGNGWSVRYVFAEPPQDTAATTAALSGQTIVVTLGSSGSVFLEQYGRLYSNPDSPAFQNAAEAQRLARLAAVTADGQAVISAVSALSDSQGLFIGAKMAEGESGLGRMVPGGPFQLAEGYDQPALFRVSQDGGLTWGPPQAFSPSEFQTGGLFYNSQLGHASLTTSLPGQANDLVFTANYLGTWGDDVRIEYRAPQPGATNQPLSVEVSSQWNICVNLATDSAGQLTATAQDVMEAINAHPQAGQLVTVGLANYHEGGQGLVAPLACTSLSTGEPYEIAGQTKIAPLGHATAKVGFAYTPPEQASPDLIFQALEHGAAGNNLGVRYTTSADPTLYAAGTLHQDQVSIRYEADETTGKQTVVVHLATTELPSCPDRDNEPEAYAEFRKTFPLYSCTVDRAVISTAGDVLAALVEKNLAEPDQALVWASMEYKDEGWDSTAKVGPTNGTIWLAGGDDALTASDHGVGLKFLPDGTALQVGDVFGVDVGWYNGDEAAIDVNAMNSFRASINVTGSDLLGANGASDNVLDVVQRLSWALTHDDSELVAKELPKLKSAIEKVTTMETNVGTRLIRNQFVLNNLEQNQYAAETTLSQIEDADFTRLISDLKNSQLVYEAVLGATGLTTKLSLLNYI